MNNALHNNTTGHMNKSSIKNDKIFVVAKNYKEYKEWVHKNIMRFYDKNTSISLSNFVWVSDVDVLTGYTEVHGYFVGDYKNHPKYNEIIVRIGIING